jgi:polysaccharide pyruvyl transferase WcaK-like protein
LDFLAEVLLRLKELDWSFEWISVWSRDTPLLENLRRRVDDCSPPILLARTQPLEAYSALAGSEVFLGEKLHANAMAAVTGVPFLSLEYQPKVRDFASSVGMSAWVVSTAERDVSVVLEKILSLKNEREQVKSVLIAERDRLREKIVAFAQRIKQRYAKNGMKKS